MNRKKMFASLGSLLAVSLLLAGCACANTPAPSPSPLQSAPMNTVSPQMTVSPPNASPEMSPGTSPLTSPETSPMGSPDVSPAPTGVGATRTVPTTNNVAKKIVTAVDRISEVDKSTAVVVGDTALVGVQFSKQYAGQLTTRIKEMVADKAKTADASIKRVVVTADPDLLTRVRGISENSTSGNDVTREFTEIINRLAPKT